MAILAMSAGPAVAVVYPGAGTSNSKGFYEGVYFAIRGENAAALTPGRINQIKASALETREFYASSSGGAYDLRYAHILDVPLALNEDNTRIGDWIADAENYVRTHYGIEPENYHANIFDVSATEPDPGQGWSGLAWIPSNNFAVQADINTDWGQLVVDHELGHRIGAPHSGAWRTLNDSNYKSYVYDYQQSAYVPYSAAAHGNRATAFGMHLDEYGNPFDVMGNITHGQFTVHEKLTDLNWLNSTQAPNLATVGEGVYRLYAHDELQAHHNQIADRFGAVNTYATNAKYGLTFQRTVDKFNPDSGNFEPASVQITLEYRSGRDGVQFYLNDAVLDMDIQGGQDRNNQERELEVGKAIREIDFLSSIYWARASGENFLDFNAPAPRLPWEVTPEWYEFSVGQTGSDAIGSYIDIVVSTADFVIEESLPGDLNFDGVLTRADWDLFSASNQQDLRMFTPTYRYLHGDFDRDGDNDFLDFRTFKDLYVAAHGDQAFATLLAAPEPQSLVLVLCGVASVGLGRIGNGR